MVGEFVGKEVGAFIGKLSGKIAAKVTNDFIEKKVVDPSAEYVYNKTFGNTLKN